MNRRRDKGGINGEDGQGRKWGGGWREILSIPTGGVGPRTDNVVEKGKKDKEGVLPMLLIRRYGYSSSDDEINQDKDGEGDAKDSDMGGMTLSPPKNGTILQDEVVNVECVGYGDDFQKMDH